MSQKKVDQYKKDKANRSKIIKREKFFHRLEMSAITLVCVLLVGWIGYSVYSKVEANQEAEQEIVEFDASSVTDYLYALTNTDSEE